MNSIFAVARDLLRSVRGILDTRKTCRRRRRVACCESLETRQLLAVTNLVANTVFDSLTHEPRVVFKWSDAEAQAESVFEVWVDQNFPNGDRNSKIFYKAGVTGTDNAFELQASHDFAIGQHSVYIRRDDLGAKDRWRQAAFLVDDDDNPESPPDTAKLPGSVQISAIREGQGSAGQTFSEDAVAWQGSGQLYDVWVNRRNEEGKFQLYSLIRNVPNNYLTQREIADAASRNWRVVYSEIDQSSVRQLESGDYRIFVREVNGAVNEAGEWIGRGSWSSGVNFSSVQIEGADAIPQNLSATNELKPTISWDQVDHAEAYVVSLWKGPDYQSHAPVNVLVHGTSYSPSAPTNPANQQAVSLGHGDELFVRVRAVGSQGAAASVLPENSASVTIRVPVSSIAANLAAPAITGPKALVNDSMPILRWKASQNALNYDVWFTSLEKKQRVFLATGVSGTQLHLHPEIVQQHSQPGPAATEFHAINGLKDGRYRFWVRSRDTTGDVVSDWSPSFNFEVSSDSTEFDLTPADANKQPLISPNLAKPYLENGQQFVIVSTGYVESFGASVLARYAVEPDGKLIRPTVINSETNQSQFRFPDLPVGMNVGDLEFYSDELLVVLSRSSNEIRLVDLQQWKVVSTYSLIPGTGGRAPDAIDVEVLDNGQILVVFNRSDRLRVLQVGTNNQLEEVVVHGASADNQGFVLDRGRAMHVSAVRRESGNYALFLATPTEPGIVALDYNPTAKTITPTIDSNGALVPSVVRNQFANPYVGGHLKSFADADGEWHQYFLSAERNGFLTWINTQTFASGFVDLADYLPNASRDPDSCSFVSPNDNSFDSLRIDDVGENAIIVSNNRQESVAVEFVANTESSGRLQAIDGFAFSSGTSSFVLDQDGTQTLYTINATHSLSSHQRLASAESNSLRPRGVRYEQRLNEFAPDISIAQAMNSGIVIQRSDFSREFAVPTGTGDLRLLPISNEFQDSNGDVYRLGSGATATYFDASTNRSYLAVSATTSEDSQDACSTGSHVLMLDVSNPATAALVEVFELPDVNVVYNISITSQEITVQDRVGGVMSIVFAWNSVEPEITTISFLERQGREFGGSRNGRTVEMDDGTRVVLHDTVPDRLIGVYAPGNIHSDSPLATVHAHNVGQWTNDMEAVDNDRVAYVTWDAKLVVLNIRTGVVETVQALDTQSFVTLDLYGTRQLSINGNRLSVTSPGRGTVAVFDLNFDASAHRYSAELTQVISAPEAIDSIVTADAIWIVESTRLRRFPTNG